MSDVHIGVDLGGTKIEAIALDRSGAVSWRRRVATPREDYDASLDAMTELVLELEQKLCAVSLPVGIAMPGTISPATGRVKNANSTWLNGRYLSHDLERRLARPVRFANDANCFALSEASDGAGRGVATVFGVIVGTGTGGGVVVHERLWSGPNAIAGEWGHNPLPWMRPEEQPGPECYCGQRGCIETFLSGPGLTRDHERTCGTAWEPERIVAAAASGSAAAEQTLQRYEDRMARALASVINVLDPDVIVLGGGLSKLERLYTNVSARLERYVFSDSLVTSIVPPCHGDASGARGAARLWPFS